MTNVLDREAINRVISMASDNEVWSWVRDEVNRHAVYQLAEDRIAQLRAERKRSSVRHTEQKTWETVATPRPIMRDKPFVARKPAPSEFPASAPVRPKVKPVAPTLRPASFPVSKPRPVSASADFVKQAEREIAQVREEFEFKRQAIVAEAEPTEVTTDTLIERGFPEHYISTSFSGDITRGIFTAKGWEWLNDTTEGKEWATANTRLVRFIKSSITLWERARDQAKAVDERLRREAKEREEKNISSLIWARINNTKTRWTEELLSETFRVDGVEVSWGEATVEQHQRRMESLKKHAQGTLETSAKHGQAIAEIKKAHASRLSEVEDK